MKRFLTFVMAMSAMGIFVLATPAYAQESRITAPVTFIDPADYTVDGVLDKDAYFAAIAAAVDLCEEVLPDLHKRVLGGPGCVTEETQDGGTIVRPGFVSRKN